MLLLLCCLKESYLIENYSIIIKQINKRIQKYMEYTIIFLKIKKVVLLLLMKEVNKIFQII